MRFMIIVKATKDSEAGVMPDEKLLAEMAAAPEDLAKAVQLSEPFNCLFLLCHADGIAARQEASLQSYWSELSDHEGLWPKLFAACTCDSHDPRTSQAILAAPGRFALLALAQQTPMAPRAAALFYMKFFSELHFHSEGSITAKMVWFACAKARELLKRARFEGKVGIRC